LAAKVLLREITSDEGNRLLRIVRRASGSVVTWRRAPIVLLAAQGMIPRRISEVVFTRFRHLVLDNFSPHKGEQVRAWAADHNVELAYTPFYASWLNRIEAQFRALRYFTLAGTDHPDHATQAP
jgi:hypothetical protein